MNKKLEILDAIKRMDIDDIGLLLEDNKPYMDVPKDLFLTALDIEFKKLKAKDISQFCFVLKEVTVPKTRKSAGFIFFTKDNDYINIAIKEHANQIDDVFLFQNFTFDFKIEKRKEIYFSFKKDEKVYFKPKLNYLLKKSASTIALDKFNELINDELDLDVLFNWYNYHKKVIGQYPFYSSKEFKSFEIINFLFEKVKKICSLKVNNRVLKNSLAKYDKLRNANELISWLLSNKENVVYFGNTDKKGLVSLEYDNAVYLIDCNKYATSINFHQIYLYEIEKLLKDYNLKEFNLYKDLGEVLIDIVKVTTQEKIKQISVDSLIE